jgi:hypothetical protein
MVDVGGFNIPVDLPSISTSGLGTWISYFLIFALVLISGGILFWIFYTGRLFNKKIEIYENIAGSGWQRVGFDRARIIKIGDGGEEIMYLRKRKVYRTAYGRKMGKNLYWFAVGQDGYWYNVVLGDLDAKMGMLDIEPIDRDMRYMHVAIRKNITESYRKVSFMEKYGVMIISWAAVIIVLIALYFLITKISAQIQTAGDMIKAAEPLANSMKELAGSLDNLCSGSGIR